MKKTIVDFQDGKQKYVVYGAPHEAGKKGVKHQAALVQRAMREMSERGYQPIFEVSPVGIFVFGRNENAGESTGTETPGGGQPPGFELPGGIKMINLSGVGFAEFLKRLAEGGDPSGSDTPEEDRAGEAFITEVFGEMDRIPKNADGKKIVTGRVGAIAKKKPRDELLAIQTSLNSHAKHHDEACPNPGCGHKAAIYLVREVLEEYLKANIPN